MISTSLPSCAEARFSQRIDGDFSLSSDAEGLRRRRASVAAGTWTALHQTHSADVHVVTAPGEHDGSDGDGVVTRLAGCVLSVQTADCVPVLFASPERVIGAAHAGWRGLYDGILGETVKAMRDLGAGEISAWIGPHISAAQYEFSEADLATMALRFGPDVVAVTDHGSPALDLTTATRVELGEIRVDVSGVVGGCTASDLSGATPTYFSHRARGDVGRQTSAVWLADA